MTRFDDIQARLQAGKPGPTVTFAQVTPDDVRWLLDRVTRLETALTKIAKPSTERGYLHTRAECQMVARAALDTEQT